jgi:hypothetical protein
LVVKNIRGYKKIEKNMLLKTMDPFTIGVSKKEKNDLKLFRTTFYK